jgi:hypothetical protein
MNPKRRIKSNHIVLGNAEKVSVAAAQGYAARESITQVMDSAVASPNSLRNRDH